jgi:hypothetical protein
MMLRWTVDVEAGNRAIKDGSLAKILEATLKQLKPEAAYYMAQNGKRSGTLYFDMKDTSEIPLIAEPLFMGLNADVEFAPVMNQEDLGRGLEAWSKASGG